jgi:hypothetical protein
MRDQADSEQRLRALLERREKNKNIVKKNNAALWAGSPMYYYCRSCDEEMALPEAHTCAAPRLCRGCQALFNAGLLKETGVRTP